MRFKTGALLAGILLAAFVFSGCCAPIPTAEWSGSGQESTADAAASLLQTQEVSKIEVYSAGDGRLIKTVEDSSVLKEFLKKTASDLGKAAIGAESGTISQKSKARYRFVLYKKSAAAGKSGDEEICRFTTYADNHTIQMQISPDAVKNIKVPSSFLDFTFEASDEVLQYLNSFAQT